MAGNTVGKRELLEEPPQTCLIPREVRKNFGVSSFQIGVRQNRLAAMTSAGHANHIQIVFPDQPV
jgi:hypothetical protein